MRNRECNGANHPPGWRGADGRLYFPTVEGLVEIDPRRLVTNAVAPPVVIEALVADGRSLAAARRPGVRAGHRELRDPVRRRSPSACPSACASATGSRGSTATGSRWAARRNAYFTRIPPGEYRFRRRGRERGRRLERGGRLALVPAAAALLADLVVRGSRGARRARDGRGRSSAARASGRACARRSWCGSSSSARASSRRRTGGSSGCRTSTGSRGVANRRRFDEAFDVEWRRGCRAARRCR